jgi:hypothetical protein
MGEYVTVYGWTVIAELETVGGEGERHTESFEVVVLAASMDTALAYAADIAKTEHPDSTFVPTSVSRQWTAKQSAGV